MRLENKVAVITGGASGIGEAGTRCFAAEGASVVMLDVNENAGVTGVHGVEDPLNDLVAGGLCDQGMEQHVLFGHFLFGGAVFHAQNAVLHGLHIGGSGANGGCT